MTTGIIGMLKLFVDNLVIQQMVITMIRIIILDCFYNESPCIKVQRLSVKHDMGKDEEVFFWIMFSVMEMKRHCLSATIMNCSCTTVIIWKMLASNVIETRRISVSD